MKKNFFQMIIFICAFQFLFEKCAFPQTYPFKNYTMEDGLPQSSVFSILQDKKGYLLFSTEKDVKAFVSKPYDEKKLARVIREILDKRMNRGAS